MKKQGGALNFKGLSQDGGQADFLRTSAPQSLMTLMTDPSQRTVPLMIGKYDKKANVPMLLLRFLLV
jgi:hypothetical protein